LSSLRERERKQLSGTSQTREGFGTVGTQGEVRDGRSGSESLRVVQNAARNIRHWLERLGILRSTAPRYARPLRIESVIRLKDKADVCCIHVRDGNWFTLSNGAVVHNSHPSDAFRQFAVSIGEPARKREEMRVQPVSYGEANWM
jgi:hypothetical protein